MIPNGEAHIARLLQGLWYTQVLQTPLVLWQSAGLQELLQLGCCVHPAGTRFGSETPALGDRQLVVLQSDVHGPL